VTWEYLDSGQGDAAVLLLVGGLRVADAAYRNIPELNAAFRVIAPAYPALNDIDVVADGLAAVLDDAGLDRVHVLAGSFGGMIAQVFVRRHPQRVARLVLSTTTTPDPAAADRYRQALGFVQALPDDQWPLVARTQMFEIIAPPEEQHAFYRAYLDELYTQRLSKADLLSTYHCLIDFNANRTFTPDDLKDWSGSVLVLESDDDATFDEAARARVHALYPNARTHTFHGAGHSPGTTQRELYFKVVREYLTE
jgi:pimeloyl-ACP methyl ester carboxylesterase